MTEFITEHWLDIFTTLLGLLYIWLEYRAHIALWLVSIIMPALDIWLYWSHGLYGDAGMAAYYTLAGIYGYAMWRYGTAIKTLFAKGVRMGDAPKNALPITHMPSSACTDRVTDVSNMNNNFFSFFIYLLFYFF